MKILVIAPMPFFLDRETQIRVLEEASAFEKLEHNVSIVAYGAGKTVFAEEWKRANVFPVGEKLFKNKKPESDWGISRFVADMLVLRKAYFLARELKPDVIHTHLRAGIVIGALLRKLLPGKIPLVADFHDWPGTAKKIGFWSRKILNLGDAAVVSTKKSAQNLLAIRKDKAVEVVFDGVNVLRYLNLPPKMSGKDDLEFPADAPIVTYTGTLQQNRGVLYFLEAMPLILREHPGVFFVIAGFPIEWVAKYVVEHKLEKNVRLISPLSYFDLPKILNASDIGVDPKNSQEYEASWKVLQYMAAGLPVVCFDRENNRHHLGEGGFFSADISAQGLADGVVYFLKNSFEAQKRGSDNQRKVAEYGWGRSAELISRIYCNLLKTCKEKI